MVNDTTRAALYQLYDQKKSMVSELDAELAYHLRQAERLKARLGPMKAELDKLKTDLRPIVG